MSGLIRLVSKVNSKWCTRFDEDVNRIKQSTSIRPNENENKKQYKKRDGSLNSVFVVVIIIVILVAIVALVMAILVHTDVIELYTPHANQYNGYSGSKNNFRTMPIVRYSW